MALNCKCQLCFLKINRLSGTAGLLISRDGFSQEGVAFGIGRTLQVERHSNKRWEKQNFSLCPRMRRFFPSSFSFSHPAVFSGSMCWRTCAKFGFPGELTPLCPPRADTSSAPCLFWEFQCLELLVPQAIGASCAFPALCAPEGLQAEKSPIHLSAITWKKMERAGF